MCLLVVTTLVTVGGAGIGVRLLGGAGHVDAVGLLGHLALIVGAPLLLGLLVRARVGVLARFESTLACLSVALVTVLVWLVASQVRLRARTSASRAPSCCSWRARRPWRRARVAGPRPVATVLLLGTSMRDFVIVAGVAVAAFGASSSAPFCSVSTVCS